jgi:hypothetical protein
MLHTPSSREYGNQQALQTDELKASGESSDFNPRRRSYMFNTETGKQERVVRRRKRKTGPQLDTLNE